jgi:hypothetical protein
MGVFEARPPSDGEGPPPDDRHAALITKIKSARWSKPRTALLMSLLYRDRLYQ